MNMAQVRKYQGGTGKEGIKKPEEMIVMKVDENSNLIDQLEPSIAVADKTLKPSTASEKKYGRFFRGSASLEGQRAYDALFNANRNAGGWGMTNMALKAVEAGHDVYRGSDGSIIIKDSQGNDITEQFIPKGVNATVDNGQFRKDLGATFNSKNHRYRISGEYLDNIDMSPEAAPDNRSELRRGSGWFMSGKDDAGNSIYDANSVINQDYEQRIRDIINYTLGSEADMDKKYKYSAWSKENRDALRGFGDKFAQHVDANGNNTYADELISRIRSNQELSDSDTYLLNLMGFTKPTVDNTVKESETSGFDLDGVDVDYLKNLGVTGITKSQDANGNDIYTVNGGDLASGIWDLTNDDTFGDIFKNGWLYNGRLYKTNDHLTNRALGNAVSRYVANDFEDSDQYWEYANNAGVRFIGDAASGGNNPFVNFNVTTDYDRGSGNNLGGVIWNAAKKLGLTNFGVREVTDSFENLPDEYKGKRIFAYVTGSDRNSHGVRNINYFDSDGNKVDISKLGKQKQFGSAKGVTLVKSNKIESGPNAGRYIFGTYTNPANAQQYTFLTDGNGNYWVYKGHPDNGTDIKAQQIHPSKNSTLFNMIRTGNFGTNSNIEQLKVATKKGATSQYQTIESEKQGGKINWDRLQKLQYGGYINSSTPINVVVDNSKASDITKAHALNGSDGGLTEAERLQIYGAFADLGGVAASFAPGLIGGIAGGITGLTGTGLKFAGDIKRDGFDWGDVKRGLVNLAFDVAAIPASLLPGGDNVIKASKFVKTVKNIGQPVLKWMGTIGCSAALINTATKIINGEKYTSEDLTQLAQGLAGGIVAGKQWGKQIGDAKLAAKLSSKAAEAANKGFSATTKIGNTGKEISNEDLDSIVKNAKGDIDKIKSAIRTKVNLGDDVDINLEALGIKKGDKNLWQRVTKQDARTIYEKPTEQEGTSALSFFVNSKARNQALGYRGASRFGKNQQNLLGNISEEEYRLLMARGAGAGNHTISGAVRRAALSNPKSFGFKFTGDKVVNAPFQFGWRNKYRTVAEPPKPWKANYDFGQAGPIKEGGFGDPFAYEIKPIQIGTKKFTTALVPFGSRALTTTGPVSTAPKFRKPLVTKANIPSGETTVTPPSTFKAIGAGETSVVPYGQIRYNSANTGGGQSLGFNINSIPEQNTLLGLEQLGKNAQFKEWANSHPQEARELVAGLRRKFTNAKYRHASTGKKDAYFNRRVNQMKSQFGWRFKEGGLIPMMRSGGFAGKGWKLNLNVPNALDLAQGVASQIALNGAYNHNENAIDALKNYREQEVRLINPALDMNDIFHKYNAARNTLKSSLGPNIYADLSLQEAANQAYGQRLVNLDMQEGMEQTDRIMQHKAATNDIINQNIVNSVGTANRNLDRATKLNYQTEALKGQKIRDEQANIWQPLSLQFRQQLRDNFNKKQGIKQQLELDALKQQQLLEDKTEIYKDVYKMYSDSGSSKSFNDWLSTNDAAYNLYKNIQNSEEGMRYEAKKREDMYKIYSRYIPYSKNGGNVYKHKTVQEKIAVNGDKMSKKAVQKMSDNLMKMLQQLLK